MPTLTELPDVLRRAGLTVSTMDGWQTRTTASPLFHPSAVTWHHDASPPGDSPGVPAFMVRNYPTAGAQLWVDRRGAWTVLSCLKANHAGAVLGGKPGNSTSYGVETDHTTGEPWPPELLLGLRRGTVAILRWLGVGSEGLNFHKTVCSAPGRKSDPDGLDLRGERQALESMWNGTVVLTQPAPVIAAPPIPAPLPALPGRLGIDGVWGEETTRWLQRALHIGDDGRLGPQTYVALQRRIGAVADGVFGPNSRRALQRYLRVSADGDLGPITVRALQARLAAGTF